MVYMHMHTHTCTHADAHAYTSKVSKLFVALAVLRLIQRGAIGLADHVAAGGVTLEHVLAHTAGHLETLYPAVTSFEQMCDLEHMAALAAAAPPLLPPGARQQYHHASFGWLCAHACTLAGSGMQQAWDELAEAALGADGPRRLSLCAPEAAGGEGGGGGAGSISVNSKLMTSPCTESVLQNLLFLSGIAARAGRVGASDAERVDARVWLCLFGKPQWIEPSAFARPRARRAVLPGLQAYATARDAAAVLHAAAHGGLSPQMLADARRSRKPPPSSVSKPTGMPPAHPFSAFTHEWGLGLQLVPPPGAAPGQPPCWGHLAANGSFTLVIPGRRPLVAAFLTNRTGGYEASQRVLAALAGFAAAGDLAVPSTPNRRASSMSRASEYASPRSG
jgi:CubicO group peptidase (beta-lactamase class C family)